MPAGASSRLQTSAWPSGSVAERSTSSGEPSSTTWSSTDAMTGSSFTAVTVRVTVAGADVSAFAGVPSGSPRSVTVYEKLSAPT